MFVTFQKKPKSIPTYPVFLHPQDVLPDMNVPLSFDSRKRKRIRKAEFTEHQPLSLIIQNCFSRLIGKQNND